MISRFPRRYHKIYEETSLILGIEFPNNMCRKEVDEKYVGHIERNLFQISLLSNN